MELGGDDITDDLDGDKLTDLCDRLRTVKLLVIDEVSMLSAVQLEMISRRLDQVQKSNDRNAFEKRDPSKRAAGFGGISVLLVGDFGQLSPVKGVSLISSRVSARGTALFRSRAAQGQVRFRAFTDVIRLWRVYRQQTADHFKASTVNLRDAIVTVKDHELWAEHELHSQRPQPDWEGSSGLTHEALELVLENERCGAINGERLKALHEDTSLPDNRRCIVRANAAHSDARAARYSSEEYRQLKQCTHLAVGAPVMYTQNYLWDVQVVSLGLMNGARGTVVAILYALPNMPRINAVDAPVGFPSSHEECPLPNIVIVNFPSYTGHGFFQNCPKTWVPIPAMKMQGMNRKQHWRVGLPLRLCWALTVHKCQGLTCHEGCIVNLETAKPRNPVASMGLAFVAWTRVTTFAKLVL